MRCAAPTTLVIVACVLVCVLPSTCAFVFGGYGYAVLWLAEERDTPKQVTLMSKHSSMYACNQMRVLAGSYVRIACTVDNPDSDSASAKHAKQGKQQKLDLVPT